MKWLLVKGGFRHEGVKYDNSREMPFPETLEELMENYPAEVIVKKFNAELRRNYAQQLRDEKAQELGLQKISKADQAQIDFLKEILESLGVDTEELRTLADFQEALKEATQS
jgi:pyrroloquinoline quinone (PQQ) biosynthesis protein C